MAAIQTSNARHRQWVNRTLNSQIGILSGHKIAVWGLTYKTGTNTLRRSDSVQLCKWLHAQGAVVVAYDPAIDHLPQDLATVFSLASTPRQALEGAEALVIGNQSPKYKELSADVFIETMRSPTIIDSNRFLDSLEADGRINYLTVGRPLGKRVAS
jgi:UDPglucose 6-dehydrogenase